MSLHGVMKCNVELMGDAATPWHILCAKTFPSGKCSSSASNDGSVESEDDSISTGCSEVSLGSGWASQTSIDTALGSWSDAMTSFSAQDPAYVQYAPHEFAEEGAVPAAPPGLTLTQSMVPSPPVLFDHRDAWSVPADFSQGILSHLEPPPGLMPLPPGQLSAPVFFPLGIFGCEVDQTKPNAFSECRSSFARKVSRRGTVYHSQRADQHTSFRETILYNERTTVMLRNLPSNFSRDALTDVLDQEGFKAKYDFVYIPMNFKKKTLFGYALVNLITPADAQEVKEHFEGFTWPGAHAKAEVVWYETQQGLEALVERFRSSPVIRDAVPDAVRPAVYKNGARRPFPPPLILNKTK